jgi:predicted secreted hydrolase
VKRRPLLLAGLVLGAGVRAELPAISPARTLVFPRDHGAHPAVRTEWWYLTGWRGPMEAPTQGFQVTFFRSRTGLDGGASAFAPRQLLFAHAALTDLQARTHRHAERIARWNGDPAAPLAAAALDDAAVRIGRWRLARDDAGWRTEIDEPTLSLSLRRTQPLLLQGVRGWSRKGPDPAQASHYLTEPQLALDAPGGGRAWMDHEWSDELLHPEAVGWDWAGLNLADGGALTVFRLRRADGRMLWAGGSWRPAGGSVRAFAPSEVVMQPGRVWTSGATGGRYPLEWMLDTPAGHFGLRALLDAQELDARRSTGTVYWEGLSELLDTQGRRVGLGYLELTGYAGRLRL